MKVRRFNSWQTGEFLGHYATKEGTRVLEIGAGGPTGFSRFFPGAVTLDIEASKKPSVVGDVHDLPFPGASFEVVVCSEAFEHFHDPFKAAAEIRRVLTPGGLVLVTTRFAFTVHDAPGDYFRYTPYGLRELFKDFEILEEGVEADAFKTIAILLQRIMFQTKLRGGKITKGLVYVLALLLERLDFLVVERYGDIHKSIVVPTLLSSGVFLAARKK